MEDQILNIIVYNSHAMSYPISAKVRSYRPEGYDQNKPLIVSFTSFVKGKVVIILYSYLCNTYINLNIYIYVTPYINGRGRVYFFISYGTLLVILTRIYLLETASKIIAL